MLYFALILSLNLMSSDPLSPYRNQPVLSVNVVAPEELYPSQLRELIDIHPGFLLNEQDLQTAIKRIYSTGKFQNIRVFAKRLGGAVELTFVLEPRLVIENISIQGLSILDETSIRSRLNLRVGSFLENNSTTRIQNNLERFLNANGFRQPKVDIVIQKESLRGRHLIINVEEGAPSLIQSIKFLGLSTDLQRQVLLRNIATKQGTRLNQELLDLERERLVDFLVRRGYWTAKVRAPKLFFPQPDRCEVEFTIDLGSRYQRIFKNNLILYVSS